MQYQQHAKERLHLNQKVTMLPPKGGGLGTVKEDGFAKKVINYLTEIRHLK